MMIIIIIILMIILIAPNLYLIIKLTKDINELIKEVTNNE